MISRLILLGMHHFEVLMPILKQQNISFMQINNHNFLESIQSICGCIAGFFC